MSPSGIVLLMRGSGLGRINMNTLFGEHVNVLNALRKGQDNLKGDRAGVTSSVKNFNFNKAGHRDPL